MRVRLLAIVILAFSLSGCVGDTSGGNNGEFDADATDVDHQDTSTLDTEVLADTGDAQDSPDASVGPSAVGGPCESADDCADTPAACLTEERGFWGGYCVTEGCASSDDCPSGTSCWTLSGDENVCLRDCTEDAECRDGYVCDSDNTCWPGENCEPGLCPGDEVCNQETGDCEPEPCSAGSCDEGYVCRDGACIIDVGAPPSGPMPSCSDAASWECTGSPEECAELVPFEPVEGPGYLNYPINGETSENQYRSHIRRDTRALIKYAAENVACKARDWAGNGGRIGLGDMSEEDGATPGTSTGNPGHPEGTHVDGYDIDIAYFQQGTPDNKLRPVCSHVDGGQDVYHCVEEPDTLDIWRTALFLAHLHDAVIHNRFQMRVVGVDGKIGPLVESAIEELCTAGWYTGPACSQSLIAYEVTDQSRGWYRFHHHHFHVSINGLHPDVQPLGPVRPASEACINASCPTQ